MKPVYICENCEIEIPRAFFEHPLTFGNVLAEFTVGEDEEVSKVQSFRSHHGILRHQDGMCRTLPHEFPEHILSSDPIEWRIHTHRKYYDPDFIKNLEPEPYSGHVDKLVDIYTRSWDH